MRPAVKVNIRLFANFREAVGAKALSWELPPEATISDLLQAMRSQYPQFNAHSLPLVISLNKQFARPENILHDGDEIALFPPVSGGSLQNEDILALSNKPLSADDILKQVSLPQTGAVALFCGTVRDSSEGKPVTFLEYESYEEMALEKIRQVAAEARQKYPKINRIAIVQRLGRLEIGEIAVVIAVTSPHRQDGCFEACRSCIDRLKEIVPVWKKEASPEGNSWIHGDYLPADDKS
jgi:MoaE-MoaD fusion protein